MDQGKEGLLVVSGLIQFFSADLGYNNAADWFVLCEPGKVTVAWTV